MRTLIGRSASAARFNCFSGWRQEKHLLEKGGKLFGAVSVSRRRRKAGDEGIKEYLGFCRETVNRSEKTRLELVGVFAPDWRVEGISRFMEHSRRQIDQAERRLLKGEAIPQEEKVFSVFEEHTRWIAKGKAGVAVELGVPVCVAEDQCQFILNHGIMWEGEDVDVAVGFTEETLEKYPELAVCSFDKGFYSPKNRRGVRAKRRFVGAGCQRAEAGETFDEKRAGDAAAKAQARFPGGCLTFLAAA